MRVTIKGQVTIPLEFRRQAGLTPGTEVEFALAEDGTLRLRRAAGGALAGLRGSATAGLSTEDIMALTRG
jgi:AbrB family looped-hinge helix DNA binding protein